MLTKSAAKAFFLGGTALCSIAFVLLSMDTLAQMPDRSNQDQMSDSVVRGHHIWNKNNCMGCHTIMGEGAYYAPELTLVMERRSKAWIAEFLKDPERMYPGRRKMTKYDFFDPAIVGEEEAAKNVDDIVAFFTWVGKIDLNGFPAEPDMATSPRLVTPDVTESDALSAAPTYFSTVCTSCHAVNGAGGNVGPDLAGVADRYEPDYLRKWVSDPNSVKPGTAMPNLGLQGEELEQILSYLGTLKE
ncbi:MAG: c-type cytochrome [Planctomycetota bacterium]